MPCYAPMLAFQNRFVKEPLRFVGRKHYRIEDGSDPYRSEYYQNLIKNDKFVPICLPCGRCIHCRLQNSKEKAIRAVHESTLYRENCFVTLTYNPKSVPSDGSIRPRDMQLFIKRLRRYFPKIKFKTFGCAEYGEKLSRPHYHLCIFGLDFADKKFWRFSENDWSKDKWPVYRSAILEKLWSNPLTGESLGFCEIGTLTFESAAYVARYVVKKVNGEMKEEHYDGRLPERIICNSKGIGLRWLEKFSDEVINNDGVYRDGIIEKMPRYYEKKLEERFPEKIALVKAARLAKVSEIDIDGTEKRLAVRQFIHETKAKLLKRRL